MDCVLGLVHVTTYYYVVFGATDAPQRDTYTQISCVSEFFPSTHVYMEALTTIYNLGKHDDRPQLETFMTTVDPCSFKRNHHQKPTYAYFMRFLGVFPGIYVYMEAPEPN